MMALLPTLLTLLRVFLTPFIFRDVVDGHCHAALPLSILAGFTDLADGFLARRLGSESRLGAWMDPIADKILLTCLYVSFGIANLIPDWLVWLVVGRDAAILAMVAVAMVATKVREFPPSPAGKLSTVIQIAASLVVLASCTGFASAQGLVQASIIAVALITAWSGVEYVWSAVHRFRAARG
ncbi:MAG: CDP-alcohol phosphatidyltransferase family protein [Bryobacteraceae bacterium]|nr:CDP-alcohol phosphatidyltransferase family protein [Bryobacteraceae bacterium]